MSTPNPVCSCSGVSSEISGNSLVTNKTVFAGIDRAAWLELIIFIPTLDDMTQENNTN